MDKETFIEKVDKYIDGNQSDAEKQEFLDMINSDIDLKKQFDDHALARKAIKMLGRELLRSKLVEIKKGTENKNGFIKLIISYRHYLLSVAALFVGIVGVVWLLTSKNISNPSSDMLSTKIKIDSIEKSQDVAILNKKQINEKDIVDTYAYYEPIEDINYVSRNRSTGGQMRKQVYSKRNRNFQNGYYALKSNDLNYDLYKYEYRGKIELRILPKQGNLGGSIKQHWNISTINDSRNRYRIVGDTIKLMIDKSKFDEFQNKNVEFTIDSSQNLKIEYKNEVFILTKLKQ